MGKPEDIKIFKSHLENGLTILVVPMHHIPKVALQIWYDVGSRHESLGQKGLAHLIEHMIFKGTSSLSESDISVITTKLSGSCNAFTSHDYTGYIFEFPTQHWRYALELLADCMCNCTFKPDLLNSELKAVVQELKMYRDNYGMSVIDELMSAIFRGHPYHYPIIGYKNDLCFVNSDNLKNFYANYYVPNNATLVIVGDVNPQEVHDQAQRYFGSVKSKNIEPNPLVSWERDCAAKTVTLYRDIQAPEVICIFVVPGTKNKKDYVLDILNWIIGSGRGSRLYKKLVEQFGIATSVDSFCYDLFDYGLLFIQVQPKAIHNIAEIVQFIKDEIRDLSEHGINQAELDRAQAKERVYYLSLFEDNQKLAYAIGKSYLATHDEHYIFNYCNVEREDLINEIKILREQWLHPEFMNIGYVLPLAEKDKKYWQQLQKQSDEFDQVLLAGKERATILEEPRYAQNIIVREFTGFKFPQYKSMVLSNGLEVLYYCDKRIPKIESILSFKADYLYDPEDKQGLSNLASQLLLKGTSKYSAVELADIFESKGMSITTSSGLLTMNCLSCDLLFAFDMIMQILTDSVFAERSVEQIRQKIDVDLAEYWDQPYYFVGDLIRKNIYKGHPYSKNLLGTKETIRSITRDDLISYYKSCVTPQRAKIAIVGDFDEQQLSCVLEETIGKWQGPAVADIAYPALKKPVSENLFYTINRDQVVLAFAGLSVARKDPDYDKLLLFDQEFGGGLLGTMSSLLFKVREQTGLFYTIAGSVIADVDLQPGMAVVKTLVSLDRLAEAEHIIKQVIETAPESISTLELDQAKRALVNSLVNYFVSYKQIAMTFLSLRRFDLAPDYFDTRAQQLSIIDLPSVKQAAKRVLDINAMITVKVGRV